MADENINFHYRAFGLNQVHAGTERVNRSSGALVTTHSRMNKAVAGLALRFVGYQMVLSQVMGAQQKLIQLVGESISKFREFETRLAEVSTILQEDVDQMARFKIGIESLSTTYGKATSDISKGLYDILSAAFAAEDAMNLLNTSIKASIAGLSDVRTAVQIFTTVLNAYGMSAEQATHVSDVLFQAVIRGKFQFAELEQALGYVVPIAAQAGIGIEELTAALSTATRHGLHLDMTARGLALAIQNIINPSEGAAKAARKYGIEMNGLAIRVLGLKGWFDELKEATDKYGKGVIGELIPNMRSVRVAMVLAGEEGAKGFAEDLAYLENISGRTEEALAKMMETSTIAMAKIEQQWELRLRNVGDSWDEFDLEMRQGILHLVDNIESYLLPLPGYFIGQFNAMRDAAKNARLAAVFEDFPETDVATEQVKQYIIAKKEQARISAEMDDIEYISPDAYDELTEVLDGLNTVITATEPTFNAMKGGIDTAQKELGDLEIVLDEIVLDIQRLNKELIDPTAYGTYGQSIAGTLNLQLLQLEATKAQADAQHDIKMGLVDSTYQWVTNSEGIEKSIKIIREHNEAQKKERLETNLMSAALKELQIDMLSLQLRGMMRRRGLSRGEQRQMKRIQIEQAKLRLKNMESQEKETEVTVTAYHEAQNAVDEYLRNLEEASYQLKYTYDQQIIDLDNLIDSEKIALDTRASWWEATNLEIIIGTQGLINQLKEILKDPELTEAYEKLLDVDIAGIVEAAEQRQTTAVEERGTYVPIPTQEIRTERETRRRKMYEGWGFGNYQQGIDYVPYDQMAMLHRGERVVTASENRTTNFGETTVNISVHANVAKDYDVDRLAYQLGKAMKNNLIDNRTGKSKYRTR